MTVEDLLTFESGYFVSSDTDTAALFNLEQLWLVRSQTNESSPRKVKLLLKRTIFVRVLASIFIVNKIG